MTVFNWLTLFGVPSIIACLFAYIKKGNSEIKALKLGVQALLRDRLRQTYIESSAKGYADFEDRQNFENMYTQYHSLGMNGVMDDTRNKYLALPIEPRKDDING